MSDYPYVEDGWVHFNDNMIVEQFVDIKWGGRNKVRYISLGYVFTKTGNILRVDVRDLSDGNGARVNVVCPSCTNQRELTFNKIIKNNHTICFNCIHRDDIQGTRYKGLVAREFVDTINGDCVWLCDCDCGGTIEVRAMSLKSGHTGSCGCININDLTGQTFTRWTVLKRSNDGGRSIWLCECVCGGIRDVTASTLLNGTSRSCGCLNKEIMESRVGDKHPNWDATLSDEERDNRRGGDITEWAKIVKLRDNYTCQSCGKRGVKLVSHHLYKYKEFPDKRVKLDNGVTVCEGCHREFHSWMGGNSVTCTRGDFVGFCEEFYPDALYLTTIN